MKGLLLKDFYNSRSLLIFYLVLSVFFIIISFLSENIYFLCSLMYMVVGMVLSTMAYDERDNWDRTAVAYGVPRKTIVQSKYLYMILCFIPAVAVEVIAVLFAKGELKGNLLHSSIFLFGSAFGVSLLMPFLFRFGTEKARVFMMFIFTLLIGITVLSIFLVDYWHLSTQVFWLAPLIVAASVGLVIGSYYLRLRIYRRKELN